MPQHARPFYGPRKPTYGLKMHLAFQTMGNTKRPKVIAHTLRAIIGANIEREMEARMAEGDKPMALARAANVSKSTIQRIIKGRVGVSIDVLNAIAEEMRIPIFRLLLSPGDSSTLIDARKIVESSATLTTEPVVPRRPFRSVSSTRTEKKRNAS